VKPDKLTVLVVDDDIRVLRMVRRMLEMGGYRVLTAGSGQAALELLEDSSPDLVLLDLMMPDIDGYRVCRHIREFSLVPIIMVTARATDEEKVDGFNAGADDYVTKPFSTGELTARIRAVLRRSQMPAEGASPAYTLDGLTVDFVRRAVSVAGRPVALTATEYRIIAYLAQNAGRVVTPDAVLRQVWGESYEGEIHLLQVNIARLRKKLGDNARHPRYLFTRQGIGYTLPRPA